MQECRDAEDDHRRPRSWLVAILATPPLRTSGERTIDRVRLAASALGVHEIVIVNVLKVLTTDVLDIEHAVDRDVWLDARPDIERALVDDAPVLFGWGLTRPRGPAAVHHREQTAWVTELVHARGLQGWTVGGAPRHPSRWQRYTSRAHPGVPFAEALAASLTAVPL